MRNEGRARFLYPHHKKQENEMEHIGQKIKDLRKKAELMQDRLVDCLGVSVQAKFFEGDAP